ncbi:hypothetical protein [Microbacterium esteraromaticum]|uniref:hypothetical protein n=1 Tax=Microbacterium esteraromaticum TaxID=57043 RepID=UPI001C96617F|nr:hypothetical protein [Microbacterium esteraromaticum]MBY6061009.1 hypothetical protein [Microbacterium esteraromaticum]
MLDVLVVVLVAVGFLLLGAGVALMFGRRRVARNMAVANAIPARVESPERYVLALGVGQVVLGLVSFVAAGVMANRDASGQFYRAADRILQGMALPGVVVGTIASLVGVAAITAGLLVFRRVWRSRTKWGS